MQDRRTLRGLGLPPLLTVPKPQITTLPTVPKTTTVTAAPKPTVWDSINKALSYGTQATNIYTTIKTGGGSTSAATNPVAVTQPSGNDPVPPPTKSKLPIIIVGSIGAAVVVGSIVYFVAKKPGKKQN